MHNSTCIEWTKAKHHLRQTRDLVVNANDKSIRVFTVREEAGEILLENEQRFLDSVNPLPWAQATFSADGEFVLGGSDVKYAHRIYMWNRHVGNLVKVLDGDRDGLTDLSAHPYKPMLASVCASGKVFIWTANFKPRYSALAPEFQELEENLDYEERESEFDTDEDEPLKRRKEEVADAQDIDIVTIARVNTYDDGDTADAFILPINFRSQEAATHETDEPPWQWHIKV
ncbi:chromatin binding protein [Thoreauomyces humboldtii]|nr:chromatin binding protein [Thoreauomyces humboldtii]